MKSSTAEPYCYLDHYRYTGPLVQPNSLKVEIDFLVKQKEIRKPITKKNIQDNWMVIGTQKEMQMMRIYYSRAVSDEQIVTMIENLPFTEIT